MKGRSLLAIALFVAATAVAASADGTAYIVRSPSTGLFERPNASEPLYTLIKDQVITVLQKRGGWYSVITENGQKGWMRENTLVALPTGEEESMIDEASPDEDEETIYFEFVIGPKKGEHPECAPYERLDYQDGESRGEFFSLFNESGDWYQIAREGKVEGWAHHSVGVKRESRDLGVRLFNLVEGKLTWFDEVKNEQVFFRRSGRFPLFFLRSAEGDIEVKEYPGGGKEAVVHLSFAMRDIEYRMVIAGAERFSLPMANRAFLADMMISAIDMFPELRLIRLHLWFGNLGKGGGFEWKSRGEASLDADRAASIPRDDGTASEVWAHLERNTIPPDLWRRK